MRRCKANLIKFFGDNNLPNEWAQRPGQRPVAPGLSCGNVLVPQSPGPDCTLLPPRSAHAALVGTELAAMRTVLIQEDATQFPLMLWRRRTSELIWLRT